ncbi:MAG: hypothetical protein M1136_01190 [Chloroflexi bacterium]|nr:hypothetical protein [Chloroflexota bacterium]MCL5074254.1 hypothetical protein [Chloroflexota bacterium]
MKRVFLIFVIVIVILLVVGLIKWPQSATFSAGQRAHDRAVGPISGSMKVGQSFTALHDGLYRLDLLIGNYKGASVSAEVVFHLRSSPWANSDLATIRVKTAEMQDNKFHTFVFPPIAASAQKSFFFFIEAPEATAADGLALWYSSQNRYVGGAMYINGQAIESDLTFVAYYKADLLESYRLYLEALPKNKPLLFGSGLTYIALVAGYLTAFAGLLYLVLKRQDSR